MVDSRNSDTLHWFLRGGSSDYLLALAILSICATKIKHLDSITNLASGIIIIVRGGGSGSNNLIGKHNNNIHSIPSSPTTHILCRTQGKAAIL